MSAAREYLSARQPLAVECRIRGATAVLVVRRIRSRRWRRGGSWRWMIRRWPSRGPVDESGRTPLALPGDVATPAGARCAALDAHGNRLAVATALPAPAPAATAASPDTSGSATGPLDLTSRPEARSRPLYARWWLWGGAATVSLGVGVYFGLRVQSDQSDLDAVNRDSAQHDFAEAHSIELRGQSHARDANIAFAAAGALAAVSVTLVAIDLWRDHHAVARETTAVAHARVGVAPVLGGAALVVDGRFP